VRLDITSFGRADDVTGTFTVTNTATNSLQVEFPSSCEWAVGLYSYGDLAARDTFGCEGTGHVRSIAPSEVISYTLKARFVAEPGGTSPEPGKYDLGVTLNHDGGAWLAPLASVTVK
jgi:hypothetical protein